MRVRERMIDFPLLSMDSCCVPSVSANRLACSPQCFCSNCLTELSKVFRWLFFLCTGPASVSSPTTWIEGMELVRPHGSTQSAGKSHEVFSRHHILFLVTATSTDRCCSIASYHIPFASSHTSRLPSCNTAPLISSHTTTYCSTSSAYTTS